MEGLYASLLEKFNLAGSGDLVIFLVFIGVAFAYGLSMGRNRLAVVILGTYFSYFLVKAIPWKDVGFKIPPESTILIFIFLALILGFYFLIPHSSFSAILRGSGRRGAAWWHAIVFGALHIGLVIFMVISFLPAKVVSGLSPLAKTAFTGGLVQFAWLLAPILALMFLKQRTYNVGGDD